jgi:glycolate oxidase iron-sulfur subunit
MTTESYLKGLDYSVVQQCMHCGMCLPTCPTYAATLKETSSPRGRIALMRAVADGKLEPNSPVFADEMYFCLGCLACVTTCPAGVDYANLIEHARAEVERAGALATPKRSLIRSVMLRWVFTSNWRLHLLGRLLRLYEVSGIQGFVRRSRLLPKKLAALEELTPKVARKFSEQVILERESPQGVIKYRVGMIPGCVQSLTFPDVNRDTVDCLLANHCEVFTPRGFACCGSLHGHNGELETAKELARRNLDLFQPEKLDAIIINAAGCGSHLKHYDRLLADDPCSAERAKDWSRKARDISEFLVEMGFRKPSTLHAASSTSRIAYHEACHLVHGQAISRQPKEILKAIPGVELVELPEATWCCGSAGIYNITQPEMSMQLLERKMQKIASNGATLVATGNPGCTIQLEAGVRKFGPKVEVVHPVSLLARAYRAEEKS